MPPTYKGTHRAPRRFPNGLMAWFRTIHATLPTYPAPKPRPRRA